MGALPPLLAPLVGDPDHSGLFLDFDGTLAPIVVDPAAARPDTRAPRVLAELAARFARVAVISGRPTSFLARTLGSPASVDLVGLYGLGTVGPDVELWRPAIAAAAAAAAAEAPAGVTVEPKDLAVTVHWRQAPGQAGWATAFARHQAAELGLVTHPGRLSVELRPPVEVDKGTVVQELSAGLRAMAVFGDDLGDLPAFAVATRLAATGVLAVRVAVVDAESAPEVAEQADLVVSGPVAAVDLLEALVDAVPRRR